MKPELLAQQCAASINTWTQVGEDPQHARVTLVIPKGWKPPRKFPRRELLSEINGQRIYSVSAMNLLAWLAGNGLVKVETGVKNVHG